MTVTQNVADLERAIRDALEHGRPDLVGAQIDALEDLMRPDPAFMFVTAKLTYRQVAQIVGFEWPAVRRESARAEPRLVPATAIDLVVFHADSPIADASVDYTRLLAQTMSIAKVTAPHARRVLLTDTIMRVPDGAFDEIIRQPAKSTWLMYERMRLQLSYLASRDPARATIFMDSDVMVLRDPAPVFAENFDIALTWRPNMPHAPFNGGAIYVGPGDAGRTFMANALCCYDKLAADPSIAAIFTDHLKMWHGDQFALAALAGYRSFGERSCENAIIDGVKLRYLPCETHNYSPRKADLVTRDHLAGRYLLHFKGILKRTLATMDDARLLELLGG